MSKSEVKSNIKKLGKIKKSSDIVTNEDENKIKKKYAIFFIALAFVIPVVLMIIGFASLEIYPFGDRQILVVDLWHQYFPFFRVLREKLATGGSLLYSWQNGMGTNFLSLIAYYASSPLYLLAPLFSEEYAREALTIFLLVKIGLCGAFFSNFLRYTFKRYDISITIFGTMFALCSYMLGYYWNVMWFDTIALFPLLMTGIVAICREGKWKTFTIALGLSLIANYYVGYFSCIFTVFAFAVAVICECKGIKDALYKLWIIIRSSIIGIALGGFILLPAYYGLQMTNSVDNTFPKDIKWYESWVDIFANMLSYDAPSTKEGLPNFACGMLALVLFGIFVFAPKIRIREKVSAVLLLGFIAVSCNMNILNYIWHGFHFTNMIPYRFAFIFSFILLVAGYRAYDVILKYGFKIYHIIMALIAPAVVFYLNYRQYPEFFNGEEKEPQKYLTYSLYMTIIFIAILILGKIAIAVTKKTYFKQVVSVLLLAGVCAELYENVQIGTKTVSHTGRSSYTTKYDDIKDLNAEIAKAETELFYRTENVGTFTLNDSALYGYNGISQFSSAANVNVTTFIKKLGLYGSESGNRYMYRMSGPATNALLGIKYIISKNGEIKSDENYINWYAKTENKVYAYENKYGLPLGYMMNEDVLPEYDETTHPIPFEFQNMIYKRATGVLEDLYTPQPVHLVDYNEVSFTKNSYGNYTYVTDSGATNPKAYFSYEVPKDSVLYGYLSPNFSGVKVSHAENIIDSTVDASKYAIAFPMGTADSGEIVDLELSINSDLNRASVKVMVYAMNKSVFDKMYQSLADEPLVIKEFSDTNIKGNVNALKDGVMYLSIPYEEGWSVYIDGEKTETVKLFDAMLGFKVPAGEHDIELKYIPDGFVTGSMATLTAILLFVLISTAEKLKRKRLSENAAEDVDNVVSDKMDDVAADESIEEKVLEDTVAEELSEDKDKDDIATDDSTVSEENVENSSDKENVDDEKS